MASNSQSIDAPAMDATRPTGPTDAPGTLWADESAIGILGIVLIVIIVLILFGFIGFSIR